MCDPATDIPLGPWNTFTEFENEFSRSRVWGGVAAGRRAA